jgi:hypothetical protein
MASGEAVDDDAFRYTARRGRKRRTGNKAKRESENRDRSGVFLSELPCCGHSFGQPLADSQGREKTYRQHLSGR